VDIFGLLHGLFFLVSFLVFHLGYERAATGIVMVEGTEFDRSIPIAHEGRAIKDDRGLEGEDVSVERRIDGAKPNVGSIAQDTSNDRGPIHLVGKEEHVV
jgi:hypothetical protein